MARVIIKDRGLRSLLVVGHTDSIGLDAYNTELSRKRAIAVATQLHAAGVKDEYLGVVPMGEAQPIATNSTESGRALNRRVEFFISDIPEATSKAIERVPFNPCFRNDDASSRKEPNTGCNDVTMSIPVYPGSSGMKRPRLTIKLSGKPLERPPLPAKVIKRPSLLQLQAH